MADNDWDWTPEVELVKGLSPRAGAILEYFIAIKERRRAGLLRDRVAGSSMRPQVTTMWRSARDGLCID